MPLFKDGKLLFADGKLSCDCCSGPCNCSTFDNYYEDQETFGYLQIIATDPDGNTDIQCAIDEVNARLAVTPFIWYDFFQAFVNEDLGSPVTICGIDFDNFAGTIQCQNLGQWGIFAGVGFNTDTIFSNITLNLSPGNGTFSECGPCKIVGEGCDLQVIIVDSGSTSYDKLIVGTVDFVWTVFAVDHPCNSHLRSFFDMFNGQGLIDILQKKDRI